MAVKNDILYKGGAGWFTIGDQKIQGAEKVKKYLDDMDMWDGIKDQLLSDGMHFEMAEGGEFDFSNLNKLDQLKTLALVEDEDGE